MQKRSTGVVIALLLLLMLGGSGLLVLGGAGAGVLFWLGFTQPEPPPPQPPAPPPAPRVLKDTAVPVPVPAEPEVEPEPEPKPKSKHVRRRARKPPKRPPTVVIRGDLPQQIWFVKGSQRFPAGELVPGDYVIEAAFDTGRPKVVGQITVSAEMETIPVRCSQSWGKCSP